MKKQKKAIEALNGTIPNLIKVQLQYKKKYTYFTVSVHNQLKHYFILIKFKELLLCWSWCLEVSWTVHIINYIIISVNILILYLILQVKPPLPHKMQKNNVFFVVSGGRADDLSLI